MDSSVPPVTFARLLRQHRVAAGLSQEELAGRAGLSARGISEATVKRHLDNVFSKLGVSSRAAATATAPRAGLT